MTIRFPISAEIGGDLVGLALAELRLCKVNRQETVVLFTDTRSNPNYVSAFLAAGKELAGSIFETPFRGRHALADVQGAADRAQLACL